MKRVCTVVSAPMMAEELLRDNLAALAERYEVSVIANSRDTRALHRLGVAIDLTYAPIARRIAPTDDVRALAYLIGLFRRRRFDLVHSVSPKAGLLAMTAARTAGVPRRIHTFTGQVWAIRKGVARRVLKFADIVTAACATHILVDSPSQRAFLLNERVIPAWKSRVLGVGSISGVNCKRFHPDPEVRASVRCEYGIPAQALLFIFLGRLKTDKGILDLAEAFAAIADEGSGCHLLIVGPDEEDLAPKILERFARHRACIHFQGFTRTPERFLAAADVLCLPSYREGFGTAVIEAAAVGIPSIGSRIYGLTDGIVEGATGLLHPPGDATAIASCMRLFRQPALRQEMGEAAKKRAETLFSSRTITAELLGFYEEILGGPGSGTGGEDGFHTAISARSDR